MPMSFSFYSGDAEEQERRRRLGLPVDEDETNRGVGPDIISMVTGGLGKKQGVGKLSPSGEKTLSSAPSPETSSLGPQAQAAQNVASYHVPETATGRFLQGAGRGILGMKPTNTTYSGAGGKLLGDIVRSGVGQNPAKMYDSQSDVYEALKQQTIMSMAEKLGIIDPGTARQVGRAGAMNSMQSGGQLPTGEVSDTPFVSGKDVGMIETSRKYKTPFADVSFSLDPVQQKVAELRATMPEKVKEAVAQQRGKNQLSTEQDLINAELKMDSTFDSWLDTANRTMELTGAKPGIIGGSLTEILGKTKANEFYEGFKGGLVEYASAVGRISMPGTRATRLIDLFKSTAPSSFSTIPSAIQTSADSFRNALSTDMSRNPKSYLPSYEGRKDNKKLQGMLRKFEDTFKEGLYKRAYDKNPGLVPEDWRKKFDNKDKEVLERLGLDSSRFEIVR